MVQEKVEKAGGAAASAVREQVDTRSTQVGSQVVEVADAVRRTSEDLRSRDKETPARVLDAITDRVAPMGQYLSDSDADRLLGDAEHFGRRNPWLVIAGGMAVGVVVSRLLKASSSRRFDDLRTRGYSSRYPHSSHGRPNDGGAAGALGRGGVAATGGLDDVQSGR